MNRATVIGLFLAYLAATDAYSYGGSRASATVPSTKIVQAETSLQSNADSAGFYTTAAQSTAQGTTNQDNKFKYEAEFRGFANVGYQTTSSTQSSVGGGQSVDTNQVVGASTSSNQAATSNVGLTTGKTTLDLDQFFFGSGITNLDATGAVSGSSSNVNNVADSSLGINREQTQSADTTKTADESFKQQLGLQVTNSALGMNSAGGLNQANVGFGVANKGAGSESVDSGKVIDATYGGQYGGPTHFDHDQHHDHHHDHVKDVVKVQLLDTTSAVAAVNTVDSKQTLGLEVSNSGSGINSNEIKSAETTKAVAETPIVTKPALGLQVDNSANGMNSAGAINTNEDKQSAIAGAGQPGGHYGGSIHVDAGNVKEVAKVQLLDTISSAAAVNTGGSQQTLGLEQSNGGLGTNRVGEAAIGLQQGNVGAGIPKTDMPITISAGGHHEAAVPLEHVHVKDIPKVLVDSKQTLGLDVSNSGLGINQFGKKTTGLQQVHAGAGIPITHIPTTASVDGHQGGLIHVNHGHVEEIPKHIPATASVDGHYGGSIHVDHGHVKDIPQHIHATASAGGHHGGSIHVNHGHVKDIPQNIHATPSAGGHHGGSIHVNHGHVKDIPQHIHAAATAGGHYGAGSYGKKHHNGIIIESQTGFGVGPQHKGHSVGFEHIGNTGQGDFGAHVGHGGHGGYEGHGHDFPVHDFPSYDYDYDFPEHDFSGPEHDFSGHDFNEFHGHGHHDHGHHGHGSGYAGHGNYAGYGAHASSSAHSSFGVHNPHGFDGNYAHGSY